MTNRLSALDNAFLQVEDAENRMQLAGMLLFRGVAPDYTVFKRTVAERLLVLPHFQQRISPSATGLARPQWVDDEAFDLDYHVSRVALPAPGGHDEVAAHIDQLTSSPLDLARPLWEIGLVEGLAGGFGVSLKVHHCMVDGLSIIDVFTALLAPDSELPKPPVPRSLSPQRGGPGSEPSRITRVRSAASLFGQAPETPFNTGASGPTRRTAYVTVPLSQIHDIRKHYDTTVNNIVLAVVSGGLRTYLERNDALVDKLHAFVPVNRRPVGARGDLGNQIAMTYPALPVGEASADGRVHQVIEAVAHTASTGQASTTAALMGLLKLAPAPLARKLNRAMQLRSGMFNLTVTNVPGPPVPVRFLGSELELIVGATPLTRQHALTIAVLTYNGSLTFMVTTDPRRLPDGTGIADDLEAELAQLHQHVLATASTKQGSTS